MIAQYTFTSSVKRAELIDVVKKNMAEHQEIVEEAISGYKKYVIAELEKSLGAAKEGKRIDHIMFVQPVSHIKDYKRVLRMLEMDTNEITTLDQSMFARYVMDEWEWKDNFLKANAAYSGKARTLGCDNG